MTNCATRSRSVRLASDCSTHRRPASFRGDPGAMPLGAGAGAAPTRPHAASPTTAMPATAMPATAR